MKRWLAVLGALLLLAGGATAETRLFTFLYDQPPEALSETVMAVVEGNTDITLTFGGDCTLGGEASGGARRFAGVMKAQGYAYPLAGLVSLFAADDLTVVNLEGVLSDRKLTREKKQYNFKGAPAYTAILTQGSVECVTLANNHILDYGAAGRLDTIAALDTANIAYCDDRYVTVLEKDGVRIGFTGSGLSMNRARFLKQAQALRNLGCTALVHMMHTGEEYADTLTAGQTGTARFLAENGVTLVVGHHPHVTQGLAIIGHTTVAYSLGNCVFGGNTDPRDYDAYVLRAVIRFADSLPTASQVTVWPVRVSGAQNNNDYQPQLLAGDNAKRVMDKLQATSGFRLAPFEDGLGAVQPETILR